MTDGGEWPDWLADLGQAPLDDPWSGEGVVEAEDDDGVPAVVDARTAHPVATARPWEARCRWVCAGLLATIALLELGVVYGGLGAPGAEGSALARVGVNAFTDLGIAPGAVLLAAAGLGVAAGARRAVLGAALGLAAGLTLLIVVAVWGELASLHHQHLAVALVLRRQLATFAVVSALPAIIAGVVAWWGLRGAGPALGRRPAAP